VARLTRKRGREGPATHAGQQQRAADRRVERLGPDDRRILFRRIQHAIALCRLGQHEEAAAQCSDVIARLTRPGLAEEQILRSAHSWHLYTVIRLHRDADAENDLRFLSEDYARRLDPDHPQTLRYRCMHAVALYAAGRAGEAAAVQADVATRLAATRGSGHPDTREAEQNLAAIRAGEFHVALWAEDN
jgi:hypothetical protein